MSVTASLNQHIRQHMATRGIMMPAVPFASRADRVRALSVMGLIMTKRVAVCQTAPDITIEDDAM